MSDFANFILSILLIELFLILNLVLLAFAAYAYRVYKTMRDNRCKHEKEESQLIDIGRNKMFTCVAMYSNNMATMMFRHTFSNATQAAHDNMRSAMSMMGVDYNKLNSMPPAFTTPHPAVP